MTSGRARAGAAQKSEKSADFRRHERKRGRGAREGGGGEAGKAGPDSGLFERNWKEGERQAER